MAAAEGAVSILQCGNLAPGRHPVVDRHRGAARDVGIGPHVRDVTPLPNVGERGCSRPNNGLLAVEFRITMQALTEEERVTAAVGDVSHPNDAVDDNGAVPGHAERKHRLY